ncbi:MAG: hypothetical protein H8E98_04470 [Bacteroidetes bacterium]|nr:hypothetical protein [Bacteroidota bacterium]
MGKSEYVKMRNAVRRKILIDEGIDLLPRNKVQKSKKDYKRKKINKRELFKYLD